MFTVLLPPAVNPIAVKYIISYYIIYIAGGNLSINLIKHSQPDIYYYKSFLCSDVKNLLLKSVQ